MKKKVYKVKKGILKKEFGKHIQFINDHFEELQNANSDHLIVKFLSFLKRMNNVYSEYPDELNLPTQSKFQYIGLIKDISSQIETCKNIIEKKPHTWDMEATPQISMMLIQMEDILALISK